MSYVPDETWITGERRAAVALLRNSVLGSGLKFQDYSNQSSHPRLTMCSGGDEKNARASYKPPCRTVSLDRSSHRLAALKDCGLTLTTGRSGVAARRAHNVRQNGGTKAELGGSERS